MTVLLTFALAAAATYLLRVWMTVAGGRLADSDRLAALSALVTPAVLAGMVASGVLLVHGSPSVPQVGAVLAVAAAFVVVRRTGNVGIGLVAGLLVNGLVVLVGIG
ncbi:AzlD domain-containing protein [Nocardioides sp. YIM 152588]|uniref:AzlD domain-containing protein n=1 Tax=Nocardioides sp. YIM 152588 TaxID=3158259 RepID=UPI0032E4557A